MARKMTRIFALLLAALPAAVGVASVAVAQDNAEAPSAVLPAITVLSVENAVLRDKIVASGLIEPVERVQVQPQIEGQAIEALIADVGDRVEAGAVLARLSDTALTLQKSQLIASRASAQAQLAQAEAQLVEARAAADEAARVRDRTARLSEQGTASDAARDQADANATAAAARVTVAEQGLVAAQAQLEVVAAQIADVELKLRRTEVTAPVAGEITERNATVGSIASAVGQPMFVLIRDGLLELRADIAEQDVLRIAAGQTAVVRVVGLPQPLSGKVRLVEPTVDPATRLGRVRIALDDPSVVRAGLFADAEILVAERSGPAVPNSAIATGSDGEAVLVVDAEGRVERRPVETGIREGGMVEILSGLTPGERVVLRAGAFVRPGDRINPVPAQAADQPSN